MYPADEQRSSTTPKPTPEVDDPSTKAEPDSVRESSAQPSVKAENDDNEQPGSAREQSAAGRPTPPKSGPAQEKDDAEEEKSAAAAAKERQLQRAETIRLVFFYSAVGIPIVLLSLGLRFRNLARP